MITQRKPNTDARKKRVSDIHALIHAFAKCQIPYGPIDKQSE